MVGEVPKTEALHKDVPLDAQTAESLSPTMKTKQPYWPDTLWRYYGKPALERAGITKHVTYYTFRHIWDSPQRELGKPESCAGAASPRQSEGDHRCLPAGGRSSEARSSEQDGEDGPEKDRFKHLHSILVRFAARDQGA